MVMVTDIKTTTVYGDLLAKMHGDARPLPDDTTTSVLRSAFCRSVMGISEVLLTLSERDASRWPKVVRDGSEPESGLMPLVVALLNVVNAQADAIEGSHDDAAAKLVGAFERIEAVATTLKKSRRCAK